MPVIGHWAVDRNVKTCATIIDLIKTGRNGIGVSSSTHCLLSLERILTSSFPFVEVPLRRDSVPMGSASHRRIAPYEIFHGSWSRNSVRDHRTSSQSLLRGAYSFRDDRFSRRRILEERSRSHREASQRRRTVEGKQKAQVRQGLGQTGSLLRSERRAEDWRRNAGI